MSTLQRTRIWFCAAVASLFALPVWGDGERDTSFGTNGIVKIGFPNSSLGYLHDVALVSGGIEAAGFERETTILGGCTVGDHEQAIRMRQRGLEVAPEAVICLAELANSYAAAGLRGEALKILEELHEMRARKYVMAYWLAGIYCSLNDKAGAFHRLDEALEERSAILAYVNLDPRLDRLRPDPRFQDLLHVMRRPY